MINKKKDFTIYRNNPNLIYLDYAATTFMPDRVINSWIFFQENIGVSLNRGSSFLSIKAQEIYNDSKENIKEFFNASCEYEILFTKNATEASNLLANTMTGFLEAGDYVVMSPYEHHSNILPWKNIVQKMGANVVMIPMLENGDLDYNFVYNLPKEKIKIISMCLVSNINSHKIDTTQISSIAKSCGAYVIYDVSQAAGHMKLDFNSINADAYVMSAHKMYGPKNIGACIIKKELLDILPPFLLGGGMVWNTIGKKLEWRKGGLKYLAGTFDVGLVYAWSKACDYLGKLDMENVEKFEKQLWDYTIKRIDTLKGIEIINWGKSYTNSICSFFTKDIHPHDLDKILASENIVIRSGHMCSQNTLEALKKESLCRISWGIGSDKKDIDKLIDILERGAF